MMKTTNRDSYIEMKETEIHSNLPNYTKSSYGDMQWCLLKAKKEDTYKFKTGPFFNHFSENFAYMFLNSIVKQLQLVLKYICYVLT